MNSLQIVMDDIKPIHSTNTIPTEDLVIKVKGKANARQMEKIL